MLATLPVRAAVFRDCTGPHTVASRAWWRPLLVQSLDSRFFAFFPQWPYCFALISAKCFHLSGRSSSEKMADTGQAGTHAPQSMHSTGSIYSCSAESNDDSFFPG